MNWILLVVLTAMAMPASSNLATCAGGSAVCYNGATLRVESTSNNCLFYHCDCRAGYTGALCQDAIHKCSSSPCQNGGSCTDLVNAFTCNCPPGVFGVNCEINHCASQPCQNGGTCTGLPTTYNCTCDPKHYGRTCGKSLVFPTDTFCRPGGNQECYSVSDLKLSWRDAEEYCEGRRGHLAVPDNSDEEIFLENHIDSVRVRYSEALFWVGGTKSGHSPVRWVTGAASRVDRWPAGHLDVNPEMLCVALDGAYNFMWEAYSCNRQAYFVCEERVLYSLVG